MTVAAIVGIGFIGPVHAEALMRIGIRVQGILGATYEESVHGAQKLGLPTAYLDYSAMLQDKAVDVIHIATPNRTHHTLARQALEAGKHVICEKPLAMNSMETAQLVALSRSKPDLAAVVNYNLRFYPMILHARDFIREGSLGEIRSVRGAYEQDWLLYETDWNWRLLPEEGGELRAVGDIGTHWMDLIGFLTGLSVESLLADLQTFVKTHRKPRQAVATFNGMGRNEAVDYESLQISTEDWGSVLFHYRGGARGTMSVSQVAPGRRNRLSFEIAGSKSTFAWDSEHPNELWIGYRDRPNAVVLKDPALLSETAQQYTSYPGGHNEGFPDTFKQLYKAVYRYIEERNFHAPRLFPTFEDGHREAVLCDAILESHRARKWIEPQLDM